MALNSTVVAMTGSVVALHSAGPTRIHVKNLAISVVSIGPTGAGNQDYPLGPGEDVDLTIAATDVVNALGPAGTSVAIVAN